jgi:hypothetical protein
VTESSLACSGIDSEKFVHLRHDSDCALIFGIEFKRFEELPPRVRPAPRMHDLGSADMIVGAVAIALEDALEVAQEPLGTLSFPAKPKVKHYHSTWCAVLPKVGLVVFASAVVHLHCHRGFVCLDIIPCEQFLTHRCANRTQQFSHPIDPASQSRSGHFDPGLSL